MASKGETEWGSDKQALQTIFYLNRFTSHRATKTWGSRKLFYSDRQLNMFDIKWLQVIYHRIIRFPFHTDRSPARIHPVLNDNPSHFDVWLICDVEVEEKFEWNHLLKSNTYLKPVTALLHTQREILDTRNWLPLQCCRNMPNLRRGTYLCVL